jgi:hypothetical protein
MHSQLEIQPELPRDISHSSRQPSQTRHSSCKGDGGLPKYYARASGQRHARSGHMTVGLKIATGSVNVRKHDDLLKGVVVGDGAADSSQ